MQSQIIPLILVCGGMFALIGLITYFSGNHTLNGIKLKQTGNGQHGTARWANKGEIKQSFSHVPYTPSKWRKSDCKAYMSITKQKLINLPQGTVIGMHKSHGKVTALVDEGDVHTLMVAAAGAGKTACFLYPNLEYACAAGMSFISTDTKGDLARNYGVIAKGYGYNVSVIDLRNPTQSDCFNLLYLVNKYMDIYLKDKSLAAKARSEKYAKIIAKTIINSGGSDSNRGQNAFFYDAAEGLLSSTILLIAEFCENEKRHIISVFKLIQDLLAPSEVKNKSQFQSLMDKLPSEHKAKWFAGAALSTNDQAMSSVLSTAMSRLNAFLDSEMEQLLCYDTSIDAEKFCNSKSAIFIILPEEDATKYFMVSLIVQQLYREILTIADENGGKLEDRVMFYLDEIGTIPKIESLEMMFSASRSRRISIVAIIQSFAQLEKTYGKEGASIIIDNCQLTLFGGFAPNSSTAEIMSKNLGNQTVLSGSVTRSVKQGSQNLQMIGRPLMTADELKTLPKFNFIVAKTSCNPMKTVLQLFFNWGIKFETEYIVPKRDEQVIKYACKEDILGKLKSNLKTEGQNEDEKQSSDDSKVNKSNSKTDSTDAAYADDVFANDISAKAINKAKEALEYANNARQASAKEKAVQGECDQ